MACRIERSQVWERRQGQQHDRPGAARVHNDGKGLHGEAGAARGHDSPVATEQGCGHGHRPQPLLLRTGASLSAHRQVTVTTCTPCMHGLGDA